MPVSKKRPSRRTASKQQSGDKKRGILIAHEMRAGDDFETTADILFTLVRDTAHKFPGKPRFLSLDIEGHRNETGGFDHDAWELQKGFVLGMLAPFLSEATMPLVRIKFAHEQRDDVPHKILITPEINGDDRERLVRERAEMIGAPVYDANTDSVIYPTNAEPEDQS